MAHDHAIIDRRSMIKKAAIAGGAAWVAPTVIATAAGAATTTIYFAKINTGNGQCENSEGPKFCEGVPAGASPGCPELSSLVNFSATTTQASASIIGSTCTILHIELKYGDTCTKTVVNGPSVSISKGPSTTDDKDISHANLVWQCSTGS